MADGRSEGVEDAKQDRRRRIVGNLGIVVAAVGAVAMSAFLSIVYAFHCLDGDGGVPFVARDSAQKDVCGATSNGLVLFVVMAAVAGSCAYLASDLIARWRAGQRSLLPGLAAVAGVLVAPLLLFWVVNLPSDSCSSEQRAAVEQWEREGRVGDPPHDCDVY